jgi:hypothetical protein
VAYGAGWCVEMFLPRGGKWKLSAVGKWVLPAAVAIGILTAGVDTLSLAMLPLPVPYDMSSCTVTVPGAVMVALHGAIAGLFAGYTLLIGIGRHSAAGGAGQADRFAAVIGRVMGTGCVLLAVLPVLLAIAVLLADFEVDYLFPVSLFLTAGIMVINYVLAATVGRVLARTAEHRLATRSEIGLWFLSVGFAVFGGWLIALLDNVLVFTLAFDHMLSPLAHVPLLPLMGGSAFLSAIEAVPGGVVVGTVATGPLLVRRSRLWCEMASTDAVVPYGAESNND